MSESMPISVAAAEAKSAQAQAKTLVARQVASEESFQASVDEGFNPAASERMQSRLTKFRSLESRARFMETKEKKIVEVEEKNEQDLAFEFSRRNPELEKDLLSALKDAIQEGMTPEEILEAVEHAFRDPTLADEALEYLERTTQGALKESVRGAKALLNALKGREITAGRNISEAVKNFEHKGFAESPTELRELYRNITGTARDHNVLFTELSNQYGFDDLKNVVAFLLKGMGYDLKCKGPSIERAELIRIMTELRNLQSILWIYLFFKSRMKLLRRLYAKKKRKWRASLTFEFLAKEFIRLVEERYPTVVKLIKQAENMGLGDEEEKIIVLSQYRDAVRQLSSRLYKSPKQRQDLLLVILETLEELEEEIEEEEL